MNSISKRVPYGTRDLVYEAAITQRRLEGKLLALYARLGFRQISTPTLEYYDIFNHDKRYLKEEDIYKFGDLDGKLLAIRPDNTAPMARVATTKLIDEKLPLKICYSQPIFRNNGAYHARRSEILQSGVEIIGGETQAEDIRCLFTAFEAMASFSDEYKIELGHAGFFDALIENMWISPEERENLRAYMAAKNSGGFAFTLTNSKPQAVALANQLPRLCGGRPVLEEARRLAIGNARATEILNDIERIYTAFIDAGYEKHVILDFGIVQSINYYTGLVFRGYMDGIGEAVLSGGRYDGLLESFGRSCCACGFAINLTDICETQPSVPLTADPCLTFEAGAQSIRAAKEFLQKAGTEK